jgi:hypothetical protein
MAKADDRMAWLRAQREEDFERRRLRPRVAKAEPKLVTKPPVTEMPVTKMPVTKSKRGRPRLGEQAMTAAERMARA